MSQPQVDMVGVMILILSALSVVCHQEKFFSMSKIVTAQVYAGLVPLLLCTRHDKPKDENKEGTNSDCSEMKANRIHVFMDMLSAVSLSNVLSTQKGWRLLKGALVDAIGVESSDSVESRNVFEVLCKRPKHSSDLAVWMGIVGVPQDSDCARYNDTIRTDLMAAKILCDNLFSSASHIYSSTYISVETQWQVLWFLRGITSFLCGVYNVAEVEVKSVGCDVRWVFQSDYSGNSHKCK